jgi:hypothetical protein
VLSGCVAAAVVGAVVCGATGTAAAATATGATTANVAVGSEITLTGLTPTFTISGLAGDTATADVPVTYTVTTNNLAGYTVTVQSTTETLDPPAGDPDTIPIASLLVNGLAVAGPAETATTVQTKGTRSAPGGDAYSDTYSMVIPDVNSATYSATLNYVAATT